MATPNIGNVDVGSSISIAVAGKQLDAAKAQGEAVNSLIKDAADVAKAGRGAVTATPGPTESGGRLDATA